MWPVSYFRKQPQARVEPEEPVRLSCILHFLARRNDADEGFIITTQCLSTERFEYFTRTAVTPGETLLVKIVSGPHVLDLRCVVQTVTDTLNPRPDGPAPIMTFPDLTDYQRRVILNLMQRFRTCIA